ncbi:type II toxin-antitoxin system Phd/YefM family antitoxin [Aestuariispira ectoiniformans]|uniref:type II toxin-antitoxin system Phd/YefM family antitoxin n=1 Tax=Aestuariispira ectoiniformans TaxID=2775080 RepID=UPI00223A9EAF|nr:type II toxin-antitoxin system Phd/YefM family antitoxin [Aestuariispira ectoiniformans]
MTDLRRDPTPVVEAGQPVAVLNRNKPVSYMVPADIYEAMLDALEDIDDLKLVRERADEETVEVSLDDL